MDLGLEGVHVLITGGVLNRNIVMEPSADRQPVWIGASGGIGLATARLFLSQYNSLACPASEDALVSG